MIDSVKRVYADFADFRGRTGRRDFWYFYLYYLLVVFGYSMVLGFLGLEESGIAAIPIVLFALANFIPLVALQVRRLHDVGNSGWFILLNLIPILGTIILIVFYVQSSKEKTNKWGPPPGASNDSDLVDSLIK